MIGRRGLCMCEDMHYFFAQFFTADTLEVACDHISVIYSRVLYKKKQKKHKTWRNNRTITN